MADAQRPLRILHLLSSKRWTGAAEPAAMLAAEQQRQGHAVEFAAPGGGGVEQCLGEIGIPFVEGFHFNRRFQPFHLMADMRRLGRLLRDESVDVLHCHLPHDHWVAASTLRRPLARGGRLPTTIVRTIHREADPYHDLAHRWLVGKGAEMLITVSQSQRRRMIERVGVPSPRVAWVRGAIDLERFRPGLSGAKIRKHYKIPESARVAGMVARMQPHRGHHFFLDAIEAVVERQPAALFALAGRGELKYELIDRIKGHPLRDHLRRIGYRKNDLPEAYSAMDVTVLLVPGSDGACRAMLEAMACGRPVIGAGVGAIADTITHRATGWLFEPGDRRGLADALIEALTDIDSTRKMGEAARGRVETDHTYRRQCEQTLEVYRAAMERRLRSLE